MTTYNTGNPVGSTDPRDLYDNAENLDEAVNSDGDTFQDRLGKNRLTWAGIVKSGSGDPAIAVDAAARAEAAASQVQQDAEQIAHDAAQQAVQDVVNAVDGAADRAEAAAEVAMTAGWVYSNVAAGEAARVDGDYFWVVSADDNEVLELWLMGAVTATDTGKRTVSEGYIQKFERVNSVFSKDVEFNSEEITQTMIRSLRGVWIEGYDGYPVDLQLFNPISGDTKVTTNLRRFVNGAWENIIYADIPLEDRIYKHTHFSNNLGGNLTLEIDGNALINGTPLSGSYQVVNSEIRYINRLEPDFNLDNLYNITGDELNSAFYLGAFFQDESRTRGVKRSLKKVRFLNNVAGRKLSLNLFRVSDNKIIVNIIDVTDSENTFTVCNSATLETVVSGVKEYTVNVSSGAVDIFGSQLFITADADPLIEFGGLSAAPATPQIIRSLEYGTTYDAKKEYSPFVATANFNYAGVDLNDSFKRAVKDIKVYGNTQGLSLYLSILNYDAGAGTIAVGFSADEATNYAKLVRQRADIPVSNPNEFMTIELNADNNLTIPRNRDIVITMTVKPSELDRSLLFKSDANSTNQGIRLLDRANKYEPFKHNSIRDMRDASGTYPHQFAGVLPYRLHTPERDSSDAYRIPKENFTPMWNAFKAKKSPRYELIPTIPPTVPGDFNNHAILGDIDHTDRMWLYGVSDKKGRVYYSDDEGQTLVEHSNLYGLFSQADIRTVWCVRVLPNDELIAWVTVTTEYHPTGLDERRTYVVYTSDGKTQWNQAMLEDGVTPFEMNHFQVGSGDAITYQDPSRMIDGWGYDALNNYVVCVGYGSGEGTPPANVRAVGHGTVGSIFLSEDYGATWREIFDYFNMPEGCTPFVNPDGMHHTHGVFFDHYKITDGKPRIVGILGDEENRLAITDDLGVTWFDNAATSGVRNGYQNNVCGFASPLGYICGTDAVVHQGIQLVHRGDKVFHTDEIYRSLSDSDEALASNNLIVHVGGSFYQRDGDSPILTFLTPETLGRFNSGTRGQVIASWDGGVTWSILYDERETSFQFLNQITAGRIFQDSKKQVWFVPSGTSVKSVDGSPLLGWVIKITY